MSAASGVTQAAVAKLVNGNPFAYLTHEEVRVLFGFGVPWMRTLVAMGAPQVAGQINPSDFKRWLWTNRANLPAKLP